MNGVVVLAGLFLAYALLASRLERAWISAPMFFLVLGAVFGGAGFDLLPSLPTTEPVKLLAESALALLLFADASTVSLRRARQDAGLPERLLFLGLPLTIALGALAAWLLFPALPFGAVALVGAMLAPTDAALGLAVVTNRAVPVRIRRLLNIESGLNDGLATPFVMLFLAMAVSEEGGVSEHFVRDAVLEMLVAVLVAAVVGFVGGWLFDRARTRGWTSPQSQELTVFALAGMAYVGSVAAGGNGFVAAFLAGIFFGARRHEAIEQPVAFTETVALFLSYLVWALFGATIVGPVVIAMPDLVAVGYAVLSLTVVRMLPVAIALLGSGMRRSTVAFVGWFGPRGLASAVFTFIALDSFAEHGATELTATVTEVAAWTILLSVLAHGLTASPWAAAYGRRIVATGGDTPELQDAPEPRMRKRLGG